jgi:ribosomal protein S18 acetylase RimI-like enzyme
VSAHDHGLNQAIALNFAETSSHLHRSTPGATLLDTDGLVIADSGVADPAFNCVTLFRLDPETVDLQIKQAVETVAASGRPFSWWVDPVATPSDVPERLEAAGLGKPERVPIMKLSLVDTPAPAEVAGLEIRKVTTPEELADFTAVVAGGLEPPTDTGREFMARAVSAALDPAGPARFIVGYLEGTPVSCAEVVLHGGVAGLYNIVTLPGHRRRGYGSALTLAALRLAQTEGYLAAVLEASPEGEGIYLRLGFDTCGEFLVYGLDSPTDTRASRAEEPPFASRRRVP